jgi:hypothetical protein
MTTPSFAEAIKGLSLIADGAALLDKHFGALPKPAKEMISEPECFLYQIDAASVDRLRLAVVAMKEAQP